jgi:acyl-CoA reductase-like NAD-dependent aldehyde dehydrogenase
MAPNATTNRHHSIPASKFDLYIVHLIINGEDAITTTTFPVTSPASGHLYQYSSASVTDAISAVEAAQAAFPSWSKTKPAARRDIFLKAAELFEERKRELVRYQVEETDAEASFIDWILPLTIDQLEEVASKTTMVLGSVPESAEEGRSAILYKEPYGVILGIAPW